MLLFILLLKVFQTIKLDTYAVMTTLQSEQLGAKRKYLIPLSVLNHLEFCFMYYCHYQIFSFFYYSVMRPCFGITKYNGVPVVFEVTQLIFTGQNNVFLRHIFFTLILFFFIHTVGTIFFLLSPMANCRFFLNPVHIVFRLLSYVFGVWLICRIGVLKIQYPTYINDHNKMLKELFAEGDAQAVLGFIPELFELMLVAFEFFIGFFFKNIEVDKLLF